MTLILNTLYSANVVTLILLVLVIVLSAILILRGRIYYLAWKIGGPLGYPIIGSIFELLNPEEIIPTVEKFHEKYGETISVWMGPWLAVILSKPEHVQYVLTNFLEKDRHVYHRTHDFIEQGLIFLDVEPWKVHRKIINPAFNQRVVDSFFGIFTHESEILVEILQNQIGNTINAFEFVYKCSLDIICETAMDTRVDTQKSSSVLFISFSRLLNVLIQRVFRVWLHIDYFWLRSSRGKEYLKLRDVIHFYTEEIIQNKRDQLKNKEDDAIVEENEVFKRKCFIDILLTGEGKTFTEKELRHEVSTFVFTGTDTIAVVCSYALLCLGMYPECQEKVAAELEEVFGNSERTIELEDVQKLKYLEQFLKETMRLYSPVPFVARRVERECNLGDIVLPEQSIAFISVFGTHRNPKVWKEPLKFNPDRFSPEENSKRHFYSWIPFLGGPRVCIGQRYAMTLTKVIMSTIVRSFIIRTSVRPEDIKFVLEVVLKPIGGFPITLDRRVVDA